MKCTQCSADNKDGAKFCTKCGATLAANPKDVPCPSCGAACKPGVKFCTKCGHGLGSSESAEPISSWPSAVEPRRSGLGTGTKIVIGVFVFVVALPVLFGLAGSLFGGKGEPTPTVQVPSPDSAVAPEPAAMAEPAAPTTDFLEAAPAESGVTSAGENEPDTTLSEADPIDTPADGISNLPNDPLQETTPESSNVPTGVDSSASPPPLSASLDDQYERRRGECKKGFFGADCRRKIRHELCDDLWSNSPPAGQSVCESGNQ